MLAGLALCEMSTQCPRSVFQGLSGVARGGQQRFATQTLRVHLLGIGETLLRNPGGCVVALAGLLDKQVDLCRIASSGPKDLARPPR